jgi:hypothetical protein
MSAAISATPALCVELFMTADMPDGGPQPPADAPDVVWHLVHRLPNSRTLWRKISLSSAAMWRAPAGTSAKSAPKKGYTHGSQ